MPMNKLYPILLLFLAASTAFSTYQWLSTDTVPEQNSDPVSTSTAQEQVKPSQILSAASKQNSLEPNQLQRIQELEAALSDAQQALAEERIAAENALEAAPRKRLTWMEQIRQRMEDLKAEDPQAYEEELERQQRVRDRIADTFWQQKQFVDAIDPTNLTDEYLLNHQALSAKLDLINDQMALIMDDPDSPEAWKTRQEMFSLFMASVPMLEMERHIILYDLGRSIGYTAEEASTFAETVEFINEMTSPRLLMRTIQESHKADPPGAQAL